MKYSLVLIALLAPFFVQAQVKVGNNPNSINPNSLLELESTNKGLLIPRMALVATNNPSPLSSFVAGMTVYNTASAGVAPNTVYPGFYYSDGTQWVLVSNYWSFAPGANALYNNSGNRVGINTATPAARLDVVATGADTAGRFTSNSGTALLVQSSGGEGIHAESIGNHAIVASSTNGSGLYASSLYRVAIQGIAYGDNGVEGTSSNASGVRGNTNNGTGVTGASGGIGTGVVGTSNAGIGIYARAGYDKDALRAQGDNYANGITANANMGYGIKATSHNSDGIIGIADYAGVGVTGKSTSNFGVWGQSTVGTGVYATTNSADSSVPALLAIRLAYGASSKASAGTFYSYGTGNYLQGGMGGSVGGISNGDFQVIGSLSKSAGTFKIDHPQDPENKYLIHSFVESPDMMNMYNGTIVTDASGFATVALPGYFDAENKEVRYQLTIVGRSFAQAIVAQEVSENKFVIQTDKPNIKVSWLVMGVRKDAYANAHRIVDEVEKAPQEKGKYLHPELFGQPREKGIYYIDPATLLPKTGAIKTN
jgi:hypothetical protein